MRRCESNTMFVCCAGCLVLSMLSSTFLSLILSGLVQTGNRGWLLRNWLNIVQ